MHLRSGLDYQTETSKNRRRSSANTDEASQPKRSRLGAETHAQALSKEKDRLRRKLGQNFSGILLQTTPNHGRRARCRAKYCLIYNAIRHRTIDPLGSPFRILLTSSYTREFYHVSCLEHVLDLREFLPDRFQVQATVYDRHGSGESISWGPLLKIWAGRKGVMYLNEHNERPRRLGDILAFGLNTQQTDSLQQPPPTLEPLPQDQLPKNVSDTSGENANRRRLSTPPLKIDLNNQTPNDPYPTPVSNAEDHPNLTPAADDLISPPETSSPNSPQSTLRFDTGRWDLPFSLWVVRGVMYLELSQHTR